MDKLDNGTRWIIHKIGTRRINLRGTGMRTTAPIGEWWTGTEWVTNGGHALALTDAERETYKLPANGEWQQILVNVPANS